MDELHYSSIKRSIAKNLRETQEHNTHGNRMYLLGICSVAAFCDDAEIIFLVSASHSWLNSTMPT